MTECEKCSIEELVISLSPHIIYTKYDSKKSTWSEIKTVINALDFVGKNFQNCKVEIYTDCQSFCDLISRRKEKLEKNHFKTRTGKILSNASLYQELFSIVKKYQIQTFKIKGHQSGVHHLTEKEKIFSVLDKLSRRKLRFLLKHEEIEE